MQATDLISAEVAQSFTRTRAEWSQCLSEKKGDREAIRSLAEDISLDPELGEVDKRGLLKEAAKLLGTTYTALKKDVALVTVDYEPKRDHFSYAQEAAESFGPSELTFAKGSFWVWRPWGVWQQAEEQEVRKVAIQVLQGREAITDNVVKSVVALMKDTAHSNDTQFDVAVNRRINCKNGTLEYSGGEWVLSEHRKEDYLTSFVPIDLDNAATCPRFDSFLEEIFKGDEDATDKKLAVLEMMGYTLLQSCHYEKFAILVGEGSNGNSVLLEVLRALIGPGQVVAVEPAHLGDRFKRAHLRGKLANIVPELPVGTMLADAAMKSFTSGELINGEFKGGQPFDFTPYATIWLGTNHMPHTRDLSDGLFRRALILKFNRKFSESQREIGLADKLKRELPGIFAAVCRALGGVFERGHITNPKSSLDALKAWRTSSDQVAQFVEDMCVLGPEHGPIPHAELFKAFKEWTDAENIRHSVTGKAFTIRLKALGLESSKAWDRGKQFRGFPGIELRARARASS